MHFKEKYVCVSIVFMHLSSSGVWVDGDLAGTSSMAVDSSAHLLPQQQGGDLLLRGNKLTSFGLLQGFSNEGGIPLNLRAWITLTYPELQIHKYTQHIYKHAFYGCFVREMLSLMQTLTSWGGSGGIWGWLDWVGRCSSCRWADASVHDWLDC